MEWLNSHVEYWHWFVFGAILVITEVFAPGFVFLWFGLSAIVVAVLAKLIGLTFTMQLFLWAVLSLLSVAFLRKLMIKTEMQLFLWAVLSLLSVAFLRKLMIKTESTLENTPKTQQMFVSQIGLVTATNAGKTVGMLRFPSPIHGDDQWSFICDEDLVAGEKAIVESVSNGSLIVKKYQ